MEGFKSALTGTIGPGTTTRLFRINREYACRHGYSFFMPSSPWLTILQPGVSPTNGDKQARADGCERRDRCTELHATAHKTDVHMEDTVRTTNTGGKIAVLGMFARDSPGYVLVFIDADLLLPANNRTHLRPAIQRRPLAVHGAAGAADIKGQYC